MSEITRFETGISENNLPHWGELEAVKEFVQNLVYSKSELKDSISIQYDNNCAVLWNTPSGFDKSKLLIGESEQRDSETAPGNYGEGIKVAMLVLRRLGIDVSIQTNGFRVTAELEPSSLDSSVKALIFYIEDNNIYGGTKVTISCSEHILEKAKSHFLALDEDVEDIDNMIGSSVLEGHSGEIYVNGVLVTTRPAIFGYNIMDKTIMNRDRTAVDEKALKENIQTILSKLEDSNQIRKVLDGILSDNSLLESSSGVGIISTIRSKIWIEELHKKYGSTKLCIATGGTSDTQARYRRFVVIPGVPCAWSYVFDWTFNIQPSNRLPFDDSVKYTSVKPKGDNSTNLGWCKRLIKLYYADYGTVKIARDLKDGYGNSCYGLYISGDDVIWLDESILDDKELTFKTLLHETVHKVTGARDNTEEFTKGFENACWGILNRGNNK